MNKELFTKLLKKQKVSMPGILEVSFQDDVHSRTEATHKGIKIRFLGNPRARKHATSPLQSALEVKAVGNPSHLQ